MRTAVSTTLARIILGSQAAQNAASESGAFQFLSELRLIVVYPYAYFMSVSVYNVRWVIHNSLTRFVSKVTVFIVSIYTPRRGCPRTHGPDVACERIRHSILVCAVLPLLSAMFPTKLELRAFNVGAASLVTIFAAQGLVWALFFWASCYWQHGHVELHAEDAPFWSCQPGVRFGRAIVALRSRFRRTQEDEVPGKLSEAVGGLPEPV